MIVTADNDIKTMEIIVGDETYNKYKKDIENILRERYEKELGYSLPKNTLEEMMLGKQIIITIDNEIDEAVMVSGISGSRIKYIAMKKYKNEEGKEIYKPKKMRKVISEQLKNIFNGQVYAEITEDLYNKLRIFNKEIDIFVYPAEAAAKIIPNRFMKVSNDGIKYSKRVVGAHTFANKLLIGSIENIKGVNGYKTIEEASKNALYKDKLIKGGYDGSVNVFEFDEKKWGETIH
jgi:hypothetical protein